MNKHLHSWINPVVTIAVLGGIIYILGSQKNLLLPLIIAFFFSLALLPAARFLEKHGIPRIVANIAMISIILLILAGLATLLSIALSQFVGDIPQYQSAITQNISSVQEMILRWTGIPIYQQQQWVTENIDFLALGASNIGNILSGAGSLASAISLTFVYTFFILYYRDKLKIFIQKLLGGKTETHILQVVKKIGALVPNYLTGVSAVMFILATLNSLGLWAIGVDNPIFWGILIAILNVIPYVGTLVGFFALILFTLLTQGVTVAILALVVFIVIQFLDNNFLTPTIAGGKIDINPLAAIVGLIAIGSLWGIVGLLLAIPVVGVIKIVCDSLPEYQAWGYLLGNEGTEDHAFTWKNVKKFFTK